MITLPRQKQHQVRDSITRQRMETLLPKVMKEAGIDMWLILAGENNEDPVFRTIVPAKVTFANRMTCLIFTLNKDGSFEAVGVNKPNPALATFYRQIPYDADLQWEAIVSYIESKDPEKIGINISKISTHGAGLSHVLYEELVAHLPKRYCDRLQDADKVSYRWLEERIDPELAMYPSVYEMTVHVLDRAFSREVIVPGVTTTEEVEYWIADTYQQLGIQNFTGAWVDFQRRGEKQTMAKGTIMPGDLIHYDVGLEHLGLCTDLQRFGYVLRPGETDVPQGILDGFHQGLAFGKLAAKGFRAGRTGNQVLLDALEAGKNAGMRPMFYSHPIGFTVHGAGPAFGLYDKQHALPGKGELPLHHNTAYALEYNVTCPVPEWDNQDVVFYLEETVLFVRDGELCYLDNAYDKIRLL
jgi:hypothetical protein